MIQSVLRSCLFRLRSLLGKPAPTRPPRAPKPARVPKKKQPKLVETGDELADLRTHVAAGFAQVKHYVRLGRVMFDAGEGRDALAMLQEQLRNDPTNFRYVSEVAMLQFKLLEHTQCDATWDDFLDLHPDNTQAAENYGVHLMRRQQYKRAARILRRTFDGGTSNDGLIAALVEALIHLDDMAGALEVFELLESSGRSTREQQWGYAQLLAATGKLDEAADHLTRIAALDETPGGKSRFAALQTLVDVRRESSDIVCRRPVAAPPTAVAVLQTGLSPLAPIWMCLPAVELARSGFSAVVLEQIGTFDVPATGDEDIDSLHGLLRCSGKRLRGEGGALARRHEWTIDFERRIIEAEGINFYQPVRERVSTVMRRYTIDFDHPAAREVLEDAIERADAALAVCKQVHETLGRRGIPVRFMGGMSHYIPAAVYKLYCRRHGDEVDMQYVGFKAAYQHYYSDFSNTTSTALSVENLTRNVGLRLPNFAVRGRFEHWLESLDDRAERLVEAKRIVGFDRARRVDDPAANAALERMRAHRANGGRVFCLFGKLTYDIAVDREGGPAHIDMVDWIQHTIEAVTGYDDVLLVVKPHPNELRHELVTPTEYFRELVGEALPANVLMLHNRWLNLGDIIGDIDAGLLWHGTSSLELLAQGVPAIVASFTGNEDHPVDFWQPSDREDYERMLRTSEPYVVSDELRERAALLINYMGTDQIMVPYDYGNMPFLRRSQIGRTEWHMDRVEQYFEKGDAYVEELAERIR